jgi:two-component system sensor histidine kinase KdpD
VFRVLRLAASLSAIAGITAIYFWLVSANPTTVALSYLVTILAIATRWGIAESTTASILATICFNFFFLEPVGTLTIADPQNWVSFLAFMLTSVIASQLSGRARQRQVDLTMRQRDLERMYAVSRALLLTEEGVSIQAGIVRSIADAFELSAVAMYDQQTGTISRAGPAELAGVDEKLKEVARQGVLLRDEASGVIVAPVRLGRGPIGSLALKGPGFSDTVLHALVNLVAIGLERARGREASTRAEAARQSSELRATVLDAVAHEFKTPLTSIKAAVSELELSVGASNKPSNQELVAIIDEETDRLQMLVDDAIQMLRIEAGDFVLRRDHHQLAALVAATIKESGPRVEAHIIVNKVPTDVIVDADAHLLRLALRQLLDNALKYSPPTSTIEIEAGVDGHATAQIAVRNSGPSIPEHEHRRIFERFYRGTQARNVPGTGMGLAIVKQIAEAHGGDLSVSSAPGVNTEFRLSLPMLPTSVLEAKLEAKA